METEKMQIEVEPLVLPQRPRILAQIGLFFALAAAGAFGVYSFSPGHYAAGKDDENTTVVVASIVIFVLSFIPAFYLFRTL